MPSIAVYFPNFPFIQFTTIYIDLGTDTDLLKSLV